MTYTLSESHRTLLQTHLSQTDPELESIIKDEIERQKHSIDLIASENFTSTSVYDALGTPLSNKYSEGYPGARYYGGNEHIDRVESLCQKRALEAFKLNEKDWGVNVQPLSGSPANLEVYQALMKPHDRLMGLYLPDGGHLSHGYATETRSISAVSTYFESFPYRVNPNTGIIDYDSLERNAILYRPKILIAGTSSYCRLIDYKRMKEIADKCGAYLMVDIAHIAGLIVADVIPSPFEYADVVTTTTHKSLRGPRGAMIFFRRGIKSINQKTGKEQPFDLENRINFSVFPGHQGGPHNHTIAALATTLKQATTPEFKEYQLQVLKNAKSMEEEFKKLGYKLVSDGTDSHMVLVSLKEIGLDGARIEYVCEKINIVLNKNSIPGDKSAIVPGGIRVGAPAMTTRGMGEADFKRVVEYINQAVNFAKEIQSSLPVDHNKLKDFKIAVDGLAGNLEELKIDIFNWAGSFPLPV
ncbi:hypothetical protein Kpol_1035p36 [Vanderwaltozyma polyspora DSM 70294]|uniref:Serine hydroxymethyltransferase n=1 Tax=Vanderwaltozyma polyspora (strain ATCC 22028 / DSM 70294 / BCRC 21397 / CBS 2163 / NBRC 10782 / NRRL Y-8283 / UCD 57-17) TaxID=436907 RepID=A7TKK1_VANPO|nr:uncharacterized protein Kpol_1035p36 [Vanderwaltozyma polyspora DSM 70294]EDO17223.1 hypothetical protein Kpol_1035p36 [Vanderwaltozyma polyspora DSM 70294]